MQRSRRDGEDAGVGEDREDEVALDLDIGGMEATALGDEDVAMEDVQAETLQFAGGLADPEDFEEGF